MNCNCLSELQKTDVAERVALAKRIAIQMIEGIANQPETDEQRTALTEVWDAVRKARDDTDTDTE